MVARRYSRIIRIATSPFTAVGAYMGIDESIV
jgi:hypothetical protein